MPRLEKDASDEIEFYPGGISKNDVPYEPVSLWKQIISLLGLSKKDETYFEEYEKLLDPDNHKLL